MTTAKIEKIMRKVDIQGILMKNMELFKSSLPDEKEKCKSMETIEAKELYKSLLEIGETVANLYCEAKHKYLETIFDRKENYITCEIHCDEKMNQNNELKKDITNRKKQLRNTNDTAQRMNMFRELDRNKKIIPFNESAIRFSENNMHAEIMATFDIFNELSRSVDAVYSDNEYIDNKTIISNLKNVISIVVSAISPEMAVIISGRDILEAGFNILGAVNGGTQINNSINSIDKGIKQLKEKQLNMLVALLAIKVYLKDINYLYEFFGIEADID